MSAAKSTIDYLARYGLLPDWRLECSPGAADLIRALYAMSVLETVAAAASEPMTDRTLASTEELAHALAKHIAAFEDLYGSARGGPPQCL